MENGEKGYLDKEIISWKGVPRNIPLEYFSVLPIPPGDWLMATLQVKSYLDNSGDEEDKQHKICSIAGYITNVKKWRKYEKLWRQVLKKHKVPYLHMREFAPNNPPFEKFKDNELERRKFLQSLVNVMQEVNLIGCVSIVKLDDLKRFNLERNTKIDALALNLYICMTTYGLMYPKTSFEIVIDKLNNAERIIAKAKEYAKTDICFTGSCEYVQPIPLEKHLNSKKITPIQAADFLAWEARKDITTKTIWWATYKNVEDIKKLCNYDYNKFLYPRKSLEILLKSLPTEGSLWDYKSLEWIDKARNHIWP